MRLVLATHNEGKVRELREMLSRAGHEGVAARELGVTLDVEETGSTFEENAELKARAVFEIVNKDKMSYGVLADDSGLIVDALDGAPGVYSARFGGLESPSERNALLLKRLSGVFREKRSARFACAMVCLLPDGTRLVSTGFCEGLIADAPRGENGFGYDPLFVPEGFSETLGELPSEVKNEISHRGKALKALESELTGL